MTFTAKLFTEEFHMPSLLEPAVTNARFASLHGLPVVPVPLSTTPVPLLKPRARHELAWCRTATRAAGFRLRLGGGATLRLRSCVSPSALHFSRSPTTDRSQEIRTRGNVMNSPYSNWPISDFSITDCKIASHSACRRDNAMKPLLILWRRRSRQGYYGSLA